MTALSLPLKRRRLLQQWRHMAPDSKSKCFLVSKENSVLWSSYSLYWQYGSFILDQPAKRRLKSPANQLFFISVNNITREKRQISQVICTRNPPVSDRCQSRRHHVGQYTETLQYILSVCLDLVFYYSGHFTPATYSYELRRICYSMSLQ